MWSRKRLLIWGKTYPEFSKSYYETVCTGALDAETGRLLRIYPISLRYMKDPISTFDWVDAEIERNSKDYRPESYRIRQDSIARVDHLGVSKPDWRKRTELILGAGNVFPSVEALLAAEEKDHTSLGLVRPKRIKRFYAKTREIGERREWVEKREEAIRQKDLFVDPDSKTRDLEFPWVQFRAEFTCESSSCNGHDLSILDWGTYVLERKQREAHAIDPAKDVVAQLERLTDPSRHEPYFFLGNTMAHCRSFMIVGVFGPPRELPAKPKAAKNPGQLDLFSKV